jgi:hypothetical protein
VKDHDVWTACGVAGVADIACYLLAVLVPWPESQLGISASLLAVSGFPLLGIVFAYGLHGFIAAEREGAANRLAFVFAAAAFATLLAMLFVQLAVGAGIGTMARELDEVAARSLKRGLRLVDFGLDVAWDFLIGTALILWGVAMRRRSGLGPLWGYPSLAFGVALIGLNAATFPWPPGDHGLFDIGPFIAVYMAVLAGRLVVLARRAARQAV